MFQPEIMQKSSEELITEWQLTLNDMQYTEQEFNSLRTYRMFASSMRPRIAIWNPTLKQSRMQILLSKSFSK